jgi:hypothetical protein
MLHHVMMYSEYSRGILPSNVHCSRHRKRVSERDMHMYAREIEYTLPRVRVPGNLQG